MMAWITFRCDRCLRVHDYLIAPDGPLPCPGYSFSMHEGCPGEMTPKVPTGWVCVPGPEVRPS